MNSMLAAIADSSEANHNQREPGRLLYGVDEKDGDRSSSQYTSDAGEPALRRENALGQTLHVVGGRWKAALSNARRCARIRRTRQ